MKRTYDIIFLTNTPSFYKLNLCNEIAKHKSLLLVLYGYGAEAVNRQMEDGEWTFDYEFVNEGDANSRNTLRTLFNLLLLMRKVKAKRILFSGWLAMEYNLFSLISPRKKNALLCESAIWDVDLKGIKGLVKKTIISRMNYVLPSGTPHNWLFDKVGFKGSRYITGSVGIINKSERKSRAMNPIPRYLYVGRLVDVKNLGFLIDVFNKNGRLLTIVGRGPLKSQLKEKAKNNISFKGFVDNEDLGEIYQSHDVFILPSYSEPWGLVVEEAIYWGLPVIVSDRVGCGIDMVKTLGTGEIFKSGDANDLQDKIDVIEKNYSRYSEAVDKVDFTKRDLSQINAYLKIFD